MTNLDVTIHRVENIEEASELKRWMSKNHEYLAVDTETEGLEWWHEKPRLFQIGNAHEAFTLEWDGWGVAIAEILNNFHGDILMHNAKFDTTMIEHWSNGKVKLPRHKIKDTAIMANILDPSRPVGLKPLSEQYVDRQAARSQAILAEAMQTHGWTWKTVPLDFQPYWMYGGLDCILTSRLYDKFYPEVMAEAPASYELEQGTVWSLMDLERKGIEVDVEYTKMIKQKFLDYVDQCDDWMDSSYGFSARQPHHKEKLIAQIQKDTDYVFTEITDGAMTKFKNSYSREPTVEEVQKLGINSLKLDKEVIDDIVWKTNHPMMSTEKLRRKHSNMVSKYLETFINSHHNGRLHASFNQLNKQESVGRKYGAVTGRMTVRNPALQTLPRRSDDDSPEALAANAIRNCLTATEGGKTHKLLLADFDQFEQRIQASYSQDEKLLEAFRRVEEGGEDYFTILGREIYQDLTMQKSDYRRTTTKNTIYASGYGAGIPKLAQTAGVSIAEMQHFMSTYGKAYPQLKAWTENIIHTAQKRYDTEGVAYVRSPMTGRKLPALYRDKAYTLVNYFVQGLQAEIMKSKTLELRKAGIEGIVLLVHDEFICDIPNEEVEDVSHILLDTMNDDQILPGVKVTAGLDIAERWGGQVK